jgi:protein-S-isoprenylcysteine O-methyltransferase Ste14
MIAFYNTLFALMWLAWIAYWWLLSRRVKATSRREPLSSRLSHLVPLVLAIVLVFPRKCPIAILNERFLPLVYWRMWAGIGAALVAIGLLFTVWARVHLGRNWSGVVTLKQDHELITSGPYRWVRHPIYTGLIFAFIGQALARGEWRGLVALLLVIGALWRKLRIEERWMHEQFGDAYLAYRLRVTALFPFIV